MRTLSDDVAKHKEDGNVPALEKIRDEIGEVVLFTRDRVALLTEQGKPRSTIAQSQKNLAQAEMNFAMVQGTIDSIINPQ